MTPILGILGGTFDPIHYGHLELAREVGAAAGLSEVRLVPTGDPPHRSAPVASAQHRLAMAELARAEYPELVVDAREVCRPGRSYTVLTLEELRAELPQSTLALIVGADSFAGLATWHRWRELLELAHVVVVARPGAAFDGVEGRFTDEGALPPELAAEWARRFDPSPAALAAARAGTITRVAITPWPISATTIRTALRRGESALVRGLLPPAVFAYIERNRLYAPDQDAT